MKRKVKRDAADTNNNTPTESLSRDQREAQYTKEASSKSKNRNSKHGLHP